MQEILNFRRRPCMKEKDIKNTFDVYVIYKSRKVSIYQNKQVKFCFDYNSDVIKVLVCDKDNIELKNRIKEYFQEKEQQYLQNLKEYHQNKKQQCKEELKKYTLYQYKYKHNKNENRIIESIIITTDARQYNRIHDCKSREVSYDIIYLTESNIELAKKYFIEAEEKKMKQLESKMEKCKKKIDLINLCECEKE